MKLVEPEWSGRSQENVTKKEKLLAEAGYTADKPLTFNLLYNTSDLHKNWRLPLPLSGRKTRARTLSWKPWE